MLAEKLDNRRTEEHTKFVEEGNQTLEKYFISFENYCKNNKKDDRDTWLDELEKNLTGETLVANEGMRDANQSYEMGEEKLLTWYKGRQTVRKKRARERFNRASHKTGATLYLYSTILESLSKKAYPSSNPEKSKVPISK